MSLLAEALLPADSVGEGCRPLLPKDDGNRDAADEQGPSDAALVVENGNGTVSNVISLLQLDSKIEQKFLLVSEFCIPLESEAVLVTDKVLISRWCSLAWRWGVRRRSVADDPAIKNTVFSFVNCCNNFKSNNSMPFSVKICQRTFGGRTNLLEKGFEPRTWRTQSQSFTKVLRQAAGWLGSRKSELFFRTHHKHNGIPAQSI